MKKAILGSLFLLVIMFSVSSEASSADPLANWHKRWPPLFPSVNVARIDFLNEMFFIPPYFTSSDGRAWESWNSLQYKGAASVAYGNGIYVAVGAGPNLCKEEGALYTSSDGLAWKKTFSREMFAFMEITYGSGSFVALGYNLIWEDDGIVYDECILLTSPDGVTWDATFSSKNEQLQHMFYANGIFLALGFLGEIRTSSDGITWTRVNSGTDAHLWDVAYGNDTFVATGQICRASRCNGIALRSPDGMAWTKKEVTDVSILQGVTYGSGKFCSPARYSILTSTDGENWIKQTIPVVENEAFTSVAYGNGIFIVVGAYRSTILTSTDGEIWEQAPKEISAPILEAVTYGDGGFVAVGKAIIRSPDGETWTESNSPVTTTLNAVTYGNGSYVGVGANGTIISSPDGTSWTQSTSPTSYGLGGVAYGNSIFVAVGKSGSILTSPDGVDWTDRSYPRTIDFGHVAYGNGIFVAVGYWLFNGRYVPRVLTSPDGITWTERTLPEGTKLCQGLTYGNGIFILCSRGGVITSRNGVKWTKTNGSSLNALSFGNDTFLGIKELEYYDCFGDVNTKYLLVTSADGTKWTERGRLSSGFRSFAFGNHTFISLADSFTSRGGIYQSDPLPEFPKIKVLTPNGEEFLDSGSPATVQWGAPPEAVAFDVEYSVDGGISWKPIETGAEGNSCGWTVPFVTKNQKQCLVKVTGYDDLGTKVGADRSDTPFTVEVLTITDPKNKSSCTSGQTCTIAWEKAPAVDAQTGQLFFSADGGFTWKLIIDTITGSDTSFAWIPTVKATKTDCKVKLIYNDRTGKKVATAMSVGKFSIVVP